MTENKFTTGVRFVYDGWFITVGPWQMKVRWPNGGRFSNGSRWHSPWYRWADQPEY